MTQRPRGRRLRIDASRSLVLDVLHFARKVPCFPAEKYFDLAALAGLRDRLAVRISWSVLFAKAYALVAMEIPELRRAYLRWPWPHFYQHHASVATIALSRQHGGKDWLFWARLMEPEKKTLAELQGLLLGHQRQPVEQVFERHLLMSRFPAWLRRPIWWYRIHLAPHSRARRTGTFGLSVLAGQGVLNRMHPHFLTTSLSYGPLDPAGRVLVTLICDHRVLDGITAARALNQLEAVLRGPIHQELAELDQGSLRPPMDRANRPGERHAA